ncbi:MAG: hypothetical protein KGY45_03255 [Hadesarchaea archaeon]|nr:hypothetical protein [Hadesarchaea archaeon]
MDMFEGKKGHKIYSNKKDAEFLANLVGGKEAEAKVLEVKVKDGDKAEKEGFTIHQDISIAASSPSTGEKGWIVLKENEGIQESLKKVIEPINE